VVRRQSSQVVLIMGVMEAPSDRFSRPIGIRTSLAVMPLRRRPDPEPTLSILPGPAIGDRFTDADPDGAAEWEVASRPVTSRKGHEVRACVPRPGNPATARERYWLI
jgi:hypothetical protein